MVEFIMLYKCINTVGILKVLIKKWYTVHSQGMHYACTVKVGHIEWIAMYKRTTGKTLLNQFHLKQAINMLAGASEAISLCRGHR